MGNKIFGEDIFINDGEYYSYHDLNDAFQELYTNNYFCALSSILNKKKIIIIMKYIKALFALHIIQCIVAINLEQFK